MKKEDILAQLSRYRTNRGWGRWFFGATKGFEDLKYFHRRLEDGELSMEKLQELLGLLCKRRARLLGRDDNYDTDKGKRKLTNVIYLDIERQLVNAYRTKMVEQGVEQDSIDQYLPTNTPITQLVLLQNNDKTQWYAFQIAPYLRSQTMKGFVNPYTQEDLPEETFDTLASWGKNLFIKPLISTYRNLLRKLKNIMVGSNNDTVVVMDMIIDKKNQPLNIRTEIRTCTYKQFKIKRDPIKLALDGLTNAHDPMFKVAFKLMNETYERLENKPADYDYHHHDDDIPMVFMFLSKDKQILFDVRNLLDMLDQYDQLSPTTWQEIAAFVKSNPCIPEVDKIQLIDAIKPYIISLNLLGKEDIPDEHLFISESGMSFDATLLLQTFTVESGLINPSTNKEFSDEDLKQLREHPLVGEAFQRLERMLGQYPTDKESPYPKPSMLLHLFVSANGDVIDIYQQEDLIKHITDLYLADQLTRNEFRDILNLAYDQTAADIALKQSLTVEEEDVLTDDPIFENLKRAVRFQSKLTFEDLPKQTFWALMHRELLLVLKVQSLPKTPMPIMNGAASTTLAIQTFDNDPEQYLRISGHSGSFNYPLGGGSDQFREHQYVVRMPSIYGDVNGRAALKNIVGTFKGSLLTALRHDLCKEMLNHIDTSGICVGERVRTLNAWRIGLDRPSSHSGATKTVLEKLNDYQEELTTSSSSKSKLYDGDNAVDFIMSRHRGEAFLYTDADGVEQTGVITRDIVAYFLNTWMADDMVTGAPKDIPECLQQRQTKAQKYS